jgi:hypothetical protein
MCVSRLHLPGLAVVAAASCAPPPPPAPPPYEALRAKAAPLPLPSAAPSPPVLVAPPAPKNDVHLTFEPAFRLDKRIFPAARAEFLADLADRTAWNKGGLGELAAPLPPVPGHPDPKVIVDVTRASGGLGPNQSQAALRRGLWSKIVQCYGRSAYKDQKLRGEASFAIRVASSGRVTSARTTKNDFGEPELPRCLENQLRAFKLPKARRKSAISLQIHVGHGDEPMPPPPSVAVAGEGTLSPEQMLAVVETARPAFEACARSALGYAPELWGRIGLRFHVTEKGKTSEVFEWETQFPDERVTLCVLRAARKLAFPAPEGGDLRFLVPMRIWSDRATVPAR